MCDIAVHCVIEALGDGCCINCTTGEQAVGCQKLLDSYAVVSGLTPLSKLNEAVLTALGLSQFASSLSLSLTSSKIKGLIVVENWKPLNFEQITDDQETPVANLFKHLGGGKWTLKIIVSTRSTVNNRLTAALPSAAVDDILDVEGPDPSAAMSLADTARWYNYVPRYHPYLSSLSELSSSSIAALMAVNRLPMFNADGRSSEPSSRSASETASQQTQHRRCESESDASSKRSSPRPVIHQHRRSVLVSPPSRTVVASSTSVPARNTGPSSCRVMFDPVSELPMLNEWFESNTHPSCQDIEQYTGILNSKPYRRSCPLVSTHNVKIWFKNRRAKCKRI